MCASLTIRPITQCYGLTKFYEIEKENHRARGNLLCDQAFMFPSLLHMKLYGCSEHHDYA